MRYRKSRILFLMVCWMVATYSIMIDIGLVSVNKTTVWWKYALGIYAAFIGLIYDYKSKSKQ